MLGVVGQEVTHLIQDCFRYSTVPPGLNHIYLPLIPKKKSAEVPADYRSISFCNVLQKVVTKIINSLSPFLDNLIEKNHSTFVLRRQILDNIVVAKKLFHSMKNSNTSQGSFVLKLDMSKAYDRVDWTLKTYSHGNRHYMIYVCFHELYSTASFSVLVNKNPTGFFYGERKIRYRCLLYPYLFILTSQVLFWLMEKLKHANLYNVYRINKYALVVSHLMFADDLFFFRVLNDITISSPQDILNIYTSWSGQKTNFQKSSFHFSKCVNPTRQREITQTLGT